MSDDKKIEETKELKEEELKPVNGGCDSHDRNTKTCPKCGFKAYNIDAKVCTHCGYRSAGRR